MYICAAIISRQTIKTFRIYRHCLPLLNCYTYVRLRLLCISRFSFEHPHERPIIYWPQLVHLSSSRIAFQTGCWSNSLYISMSVFSSSGDSRSQPDPQHRRHGHSEVGESPKGRLQLQLRGKSVGRGPEAERGSARGRVRRRGVPGYAHFGGRTVYFWCSYALNSNYLKAYNHINS